MPNMNASLSEARRDPGSGLGVLLEQYRSYLSMLARANLSRALAPRVSPSDVVQSTMLKACKYFEHFRGSTEPEFTAWLRQILTRELIDVTRRYQGTAARDIGREQPLAEMVDQSAEAVGAVVAANMTSPSGRVHRRDLGVLLANALEQLSEDHRTVLILRNISGLSWPEIAERTGRTPKAAGMLWTRALERLRPLIQDEHGRER